MGHGRWFMKTGSENTNGPGCWQAGEISKPWELSSDVAHLCLVRRRHWPIGAVVVRSHCTSNCHQTTASRLSSIWWVPTGATKQFLSSRLTFDTMSGLLHEWWQWKDSMAKTKKKLFRPFTTIFARKSINSSSINFKSFQIWMWEKAKQQELSDVFWTRRPMWLIRSEVKSHLWLTHCWRQVFKTLDLRINQLGWFTRRFTVWITERNRRAKIKMATNRSLGERKTRQKILCLVLVTSTAGQTQKAGCSGSLSQWHRQCDERDWCRPDERRKWALKKISLETELGA